MADESIGTGTAAPEKTDAEVFAELDAAEKGTTQPAPAPVPEPVAAGAAQPTTAAPAQPAAQPQPQAQSGTGDIWEGLSSAQREHLDGLRASLTNLERDNRALRGRVPRLQSDHDRLQREVEELRRRGSAAVSAQSPAAPLAPTDVPLPGDPEWAKFAEEYPDLAGPLEKRFRRFEAATEKLSAVERRIQDFEEANLAQALDHEAQTLAQRHPDFVQIRDSRAFEDWLSRLPPAVQALRDSPLSQDADYLLTRFKDETRAARPTAPAQPASLPQQPAQPNPKRQNQLESAASPRGAVPAAVRAGIPDDPKQAWDYFERAGL